MTSKETPKELSRGTVELAGVVPAYFSGICPLLQMISPSLFPLRVLELTEALQPGTEAASIVDKEMAPLKIKSIGTWAQGDIGYLSLKPLSRVEDFRGERIRTSTPPNAQVLTAIGADPTVMPGSEAVEAMRKGIVMASTNDARGCFSRGYEDFAKYYNAWVAIPQLGWITVNTDALNALPPDVRAIVEEEAVAAGKDNTVSMQQLESAALYRMTWETEMAILSISPEERAKMLAVSEPIHREIAAGIGPNAIQVLDLLLAAGSSDK